MVIVRVRDSSKGVIGVWMGVGECQSYECRFGCFPWFILIIPTWKVVLNSICMYRVLITILTF